MSEFADIREFMPESWRNIIGVVPQVHNRHEQSEFACQPTNSFLILVGPRTVYWNHSVEHCLW
jgi:hypothetical protein